MNKKEKWLEWAIELQSLAQAGLTYGKDVYDRERYERIRDISAEILSYKTINEQIRKLHNIMLQQLKHLLIGHDFFHTDICS